MSFLKVTHKFSSGKGKPEYYNIDLGYYSESNGEDPPDDIDEAFGNF